MRNIFIIWVALGYGLENVQLYPDVGVVFKENSNLVLVNGIANGKISMRLNLPSVEISNTDTCNALKTDQAEFKKILNNTIKTFRDKISAELEEYMGQEFIDSMNEGQSIKLKQNKVVTRESIGLDVTECDLNKVVCDFFPVVEDDNDDSRYHKLIPCYDVSLGLMNKTCGVKNGLGVCCSRLPALNKNKCPIDLGRAIVAIDIHLKNHPDSVYTMGHGDIPGSKIRNWCMALVKATSDRKLIYTGPHSNGSPGRILPRGNRNGRSIADEKIIFSNNRTRRSNFQYLSHGWIFSSSYIDSQVTEVRDLEKSDIAVVKEALAQNSRIILKLEADKKEKVNLENKLCSLTGTVTEQVVLNHLEATQLRLEDKAEGLLRVCSRGLVPDEIATLTLHKLCSAVTDSTVCSDEILVRSLFSCEIIPPKIDFEYVEVRLILSFNIPVAEEYRAREIITVGIPYSNKLIDSVKNITEVSELTEKNLKGEGKTNQTELKLALGELLGNLLTDRTKRDIVRTYHFLGIRNLPQVMFEHGKDLILFQKDKCSKTNVKYGYICDYSAVDMRSSGCLRSIINKSTEHIKTMCSISLFSSTEDCLIKAVDNLGYVISTHSRVDIITGENGGIFKNSDDVSSCNKICFIGISTAKKSFRCADRNFLLDIAPDIEIVSKSIKLKKIDISDLQARKHEISDLQASGFRYVDNLVSKSNIMKAQTMSVVISLIMAVICGCVIMKFCFKRIMWVYRLAKNLICVPIKGSKVVYRKIKGQKRVGDYVVGDNFG